MGKRNYASVTEVPCTCGYLETAARQPEHPISFDEQFNEYQIEVDAPSQGKVQVVIYHCPFCGGAAPASRRGDFFAPISDKEAERLWSLLQGVKTVDDAFRVLGVPDKDEAIQMPDGWPKPTIDRRGQKYEATRALTYSRLSEVAEIQLLIFANDELEATVAGKYTGAPKTGA